MISSLLLLHDNLLVLISHDLKKVFTTEYMIETLNDMREIWSCKRKNTGGRIV